jgi:acetyl esterase/lipase
MEKLTLTATPAPEGRPDIARAFAHLASPPRVSDDPIATMRAQVDGYGDVEPREPLSGVDVHLVSASGVEAEWLVPRGPATPPAGRIVYLHGGGWIAGGLESHRPLAAELAMRSGWPVLLPNYRLAPEHPFPAGLDDCARAFAWADRHAPDGSTGGAANLVLAGDSAGANLAVALTLQLLRDGGRTPDRLALLSPPLDGHPNPARGAAAEASGDQAALVAVMELYLQGAGGLDDMRVSPLRAPGAAFTDFPPTLIQASAAEFLLWDAQEFTRRLAACNVRVTLSIWPSMPHVWQAFLTLLPEAKAALSEVGAFLAQAARVPLEPADNPESSGGEGAVAISGAA